MDTSPAPQIGPIVAEHMRRADLTELTVAAATNIPRTTLRRSLAGQRPFPADELHLVAQVLRTTASALMAEAEAQAVA